MENCYRIKNLLKILIAMMIVFMLLIPVSATFSNQIEEEGLAKKTIEASTVGSNIIYVDDDNKDGPWDGSLDFPYQYIQDGIDNANNNDKVYVFNGTYYENIVIFISIILEGENKDNTIIDGMNQGTVVKITANLVTLTRFTIQDSGNTPNNAGVSIHSEEVFITENNILDNNYGIRITASNNSIIYNNFFNNMYQAYDTGNNTWNASTPGGGNFWDEFSSEDNNEDGVIDSPYNITGDDNKDWRPLLHIYGSVINVNTTEIFLTINDAIEDSDTENKHNIYVKNDIYYEHINVYKAIKLIGENKKDTIIDAREFCNPVKICYDEVIFSGFTVRHSGSEIYNAGIIIESDNIIVSENIIEENYNGIIIKYSSDDNVVSGNIIQNNNWHGLYIKKSCNKNIIIENTFENNNYSGIAITETTQNKIYHNNFIKNRHNAYDDSHNIWDNGYPSGGNYWNDYTGEDKDKDGIGDVPYSIPTGINEDRYPLMNPFIREDIISPNVKIISPMNGLYIRNLRLLSKLIRINTIIIGQITIKAEASDSESGIKSVAFYLNNNQNPEVVDYTEPYSWKWNRGPIYILQHFNVIRAVAYDYAGNFDSDSILVVKYF